MGERKRASPLKVSRADKVKILPNVLAVGSFPLLILWSTIFSSKSNSEDSRIPAFFETEERAKPLPLTLSPELLQNTDVFEAYQTAKEILVCWRSNRATASAAGVLATVARSTATAITTQPLDCIKETILARKCPANLRQQCLGISTLMPESASNL